MLELTLAATDDLPMVRLQFEHSLLSISKWESEFKKPFYGAEPKTHEQTATYVYHMLLTEDPPANWLSRFEIAEYTLISEYINSDQTATTFGLEISEKGPKEVLTSELIYYWLVQFRIPIHPVETWHISRLMTLVKIAGIKQSKPKKMSKQQIAEQYRQLNEKRRQEAGTNG